MPPSFGMELTPTPPVRDSASMAAMVITVSWMAAWFGKYSRDVPVPVPIPFVK